jgi:hypothetical protein
MDEPLTRFVANDGDQGALVHLTMHADWTRSFTTIRDRGRP